MVIYVSDSGIFRSESSYPYTNTASVNKISPLKPTDASTESVVRDAQKAYVAENTPAYTVSISSMGKAAVKSMKSLSETMNNNRVLADKDIKTNISGINSNNNAKADNDKQSSIYQTSVDLVKMNEPVSKASEDDGLFTISAPSASAPADSSEAAESSTASSSVNTNNLARYSDYQLQQMLNDGTISRSEYNSEIEKRSASDAAAATGTQSMEDALQAANQNPVVKQAVAAYNFQMAYQINAAITQ